IAYSDADHVSCKDDCKSTSGGLQFLGGKLMSWNSKKQDCTAMSTAEAEYVSLSVCCAQVIWMRTDISKITSKQLKTSKHGHGKRKSTREAKYSKAKPKKVNLQSTMSQQKVNYVKSRALIDHLSIKDMWPWKKAQGEVGFTLGSLREVAQAVTSRMIAWQSLSVYT
ncbi:hypothetical protein Tco_0053999, partial [Tanacetum coccineum]